MEVDQTTPGVLRSILSTEELKAIPDATAKKIEDDYKEKIDEFITAKALFETRKTDLEKLKIENEKKIDELTLKVQDESSKYHFSQQSVKELRIELDDLKLELSKTKERLARNDEETARFRHERNEAVTERNTLLSVVERKTIEVERLQADVMSLEAKLKASHIEQCAALAKLDEIKSKEHSLEHKEKRMDREMSMRDNHIAKLTQDLDAAMHDLQNLRHQKNIQSLTVDTKLAEKIEELKIANKTIAHLTERNSELLSKVDDLAAKNMHLSNESSTMLETYHKQIDSQTNLCNLLQQDKDDAQNQVKELESYITELRQLLEEATKSCGDWETKNKQLAQDHADALEKKESQIREMQQELKVANELLQAAKDENLEHAIEQLAPTAAATSRMLKSGMSLTEVYSLYVRTSELLHKEQKESSKLKMQLEHILMELEEKAPMMARQQTENLNLKEMNEELIAQVNKMIQEAGEMREQGSRMENKIRHQEGQIEKLKIERKDLSRQVCNLLHEEALSRGVNDVSIGELLNISGNIDMSDMISKTMVTFSTIEEMHEQYLKLLLVVRDLSEQVAEANKVRHSMSTAVFETKLEACNRRIEQQQDKIEKQEQMVEYYSQQSNRYKKMYHDAMRSYNQAGQQSMNMNGANSFGGGDSTMMMDGVDDVPLANSSSAGVVGQTVNQTANATLIAEKERKITELDGKLKELQKEMGTLKDEYETYRREKLTNDKMLNEQFDQMRGEIRELTSKNVKLMGTIEFNTDQNRMMVKNIATYKTQIQTLEERNKNYETTIAKHEASIMYLQNETMSAQSKLARAEVQLENLKQECHILKGSEARLQSEREIFNRERQNQNLLLNNLEMIKMNMERSENEGRLRLESRMDEMSRECSALRNRLQEEQDRFREQSSILQRQADTARQRMEEEIAIAETVQVELKNARDDLEIKARKIDELQRKLQETLSPNDEDNPVTKANRKVRELEQQLNERQVELESTLAELATSKAHVKQYADLSESAEKELKDLHDLYRNLQEASHATEAELRKREQDLTAQVNELKTEVSLKLTDAQLTASSDKDTELHKVQLELKDSLEKLAEQNREMREMRERCNQLMEQVTQAENKYSTEMMQHSDDIRQLTDIKQEMKRNRAQFNELIQERDQAIERLKVGEEGWSNREQLLRTEMTQLEERLENLNSQNAVLHDQIQCLSTRLSVTAANATQSPTAGGGADDSMSGGADCSVLNRSLTEEEKQSAEQLLLIIKYLRKEKDIAVARFELLRSENVRIQSELMMFQKKCKDAQAELAEAREKTDTGMVTVVKHEEILRKMETYNAITDSNRVLREERDGLVQELRAQTEQLRLAQETLDPLKEKVNELTVKLESATKDNASLRIEATRWRQRANLLIERSNKTNPDDWKRMQTERENLAKMLMAEKEQLKQANDELSAIKQDRARLETELANVTKQLEARDEKIKKLEIDLQRDISQASTKLTGEIESLKAELKTKDEQLADARNKEQQIRKIAKRYKDSYFELKKEVDEKEASGGSSVEKTTTTTVPAAAVSGAESDVVGGASTTAAEMDVLRKKLETAVEEVDTLQKGNELLRAQLDKADRSQALLNEAKSRIDSITDQNKAAVRELNVAKVQLQQLREENELLKKQYEGHMSRYEKDTADADRESKEAIARLSRENEQLVIRLNQLNRQLGLQQAAKPSTSAVGAGSSEKPVGESVRTANVKPMAGPSNQQSAAVTPRRVSETPLASIRPMAVGSRTAAVLPTSQSTTNVAIVQGSSSSSTSSAATAAAVAAVAAAASSGGASTTGTLSTVSGSSSTGGTIAVQGGANSGVTGSSATSGSVVVSGGPSSAVGSGSGPSAAGSVVPASTCGVTTALVPPQQQVHSATATSSSSTTSGGSGSNLNESMASSSPTSSHTDYMPATSSASVAVAAVPPMGTATTSTNAAESSSSSTSTSHMAEGESVAQMGSSSSTDPSQQQQAQQQAVPQAAVAMVLPQVEGGVSQPQHQVQQQPQHQQQQQQHQATLAQQQLAQQQSSQPQQAQQQQLVLSAPQASSSNTVTTTQAGHKRLRDVEGDSSTDTVGHQQSTSKPTPAKKRLRTTQVAGEVFQGVSESGLDVEYQVPTSSQRDQEDDIVVVDSEEDDEEDDDDEDDDEEEEDVGMADEGTAEADDGPFQGYVVEESYEQEGSGMVAAGAGPYDEGEGPDIDEDDNIEPSANNEVDVDEDNEAPNACGTTSTTSTSTSSSSSQSVKLQLQQQQQQPMETADAETSSTTTTTNPVSGATTAAVLPGPSSITTSGSSGGAVGSPSINDGPQQPHIQSTTGSSGGSQSCGTPIVLPSAAASSSSTAEATASAVAGSSNAAMPAATRQVVNPLSRQQQQAAHLMLMNFEHESADDRIVPSTPTLYVTRRTDGSS
ncbi:nucleoprotein TPR isoform X3 [Anopheles coustani]|uniref:nucleoprotein TPR isoform X3 n=1 Tax=Anopheles coustani TaxID=139045 RepID=UPI00265AAD92|nr:nucleoprotein TPR isoform X3 [Anopheles coustani]